MSRREIRVDMTPEALDALIELLDDPGMRARLERNWRIRDAREALETAYRKTDTR